MANTVALTAQVPTHFEPSTPLQWNRTSGPTTEHPITPESGSVPSLWTAWLDYFATGEGRAIMACITWAASEDEARRHFGKTFDPGYAKGCDALPGVVRNELTLLLWSEKALDLVESIADRRAAVDLNALLHFNFS